MTKASGDRPDRLTHCRREVENRCSRSRTHGSYFVKIRANGTNTRVPIMSAGKTLWLDERAAYIFDNCCVRRQPSTSGRSAEVESRGCGPHWSHTSRSVRTISFSKISQMLIPRPASKRSLSRTGQIHYLAGADDPADAHRCFLSYAAVLYRNVGTVFDVNVALNGAAHRTRICCSSGR